MTEKQKYKTELCKAWELNAKCEYDDKCTFAHGEKELREVKRGSSYKTQTCRSFNEKGYCNYGKRCQYTHYSPRERYIYYTYLILFKF